MSSLNNVKQHIVKKIKAELTVPPALSQEKDRAEQLKRAIQQALENIVPELDRIYGDNRSYRMESLPVELNLQKDDLSQLATLLEEALIDKIKNVRQKTAIQNKEEDYHVEKIGPGQRRGDLLRYFLETGRFPWWAEGASFADVEDRLWGMSAKEWKDLIKPLVLDHPEVLRRLAAQFSEDLLQQLIKKSSDSKRSSVDEIIKLLKDISSFLGKQNLAYGTRRRVVTQLYEHAFSGILFDEEPKPIFSKIMGITLASLHEVETGIEEWKKWLDKADRNKDFWLDLLDDKPVIEVEGKEEEEKEEWDGDTEIPEDEDLYISNGGLVLLHPFIESLFENLGLLEEGDFSQKSARERAVCLLYYLATGREEFPEHELVLPKFLCGWSSGVPVSRFLPISEYEIEECDKVLSSAISHWEALKSTSVEGFRSNFLQRKGILREEEFGWSLYIERKTQDILLEKLPWNLSIVKLEWMDKMLTVHWQ